MARKRRDFWWSVTLLAFLTVLAFLVYPLATVLVTFALWRTQVLSEGEARMRDAVAAGLLWGLASLTRTQNLAFPVALAAWLIWKARLGLRKQVLVFLVLAFLPPMLWAARNWRQFGALSGLIGMIPWFLGYKVAQTAFFSYII